MKKDKESWNTEKYKDDEKRKQQMGEIENEKKRLMEVQKHQYEEKINGLNNFYTTVSVIIWTLNAIRESIEFYEYQ